jgi:hypothetical protein
MMLRRLSQSLKQQNWTAILIEFVLLVVGVVLGLQVTNWNQERATERQAAEFTQRLREDMRVEAWRFNAVELYYPDVLANAQRTLAALEGKSSLTNEALLIAAYRATQYGDFVQSPGTYQELLSTGNVGLVTDPELRDMAAQVYSSPLYQNLKDEGINSPYRVAFRMRVPLEVQTALGSRCGDKLAVINNYESIKNQLDYPCTTGLSQQVIDAAAAGFRSDASLVPLLRLRITNINSAVSLSILSADVVARMHAEARKKP